jgi:hypothetical protein
MDPVGRSQLRQGTARTGHGNRPRRQMAVRASRASEPDESLLPLFAPEPIEPVNRWDPGTAACSPAARAEAVRDAIAIVESAGHIAAGIYETVSSRYYLLNSNGVFAHTMKPWLRFSITAMAGDSSSGWAKECSSRPVRASTPSHSPAAPPPKRRSRHRPGASTRAGIGHSRTRRRAGHRGPDVRRFSATAVRRSAQFPHRTRRRATVRDRTLDR